MERHLARNARDDRLELCGRPETVALPLHQEHRHEDARQVVGALSVGPAGRVQWIAEHDDAGKPVLGLGRQVRGDASPHRLSSHEQRQAII